MVFIHGLGGDAFETWRYGKDKSTSWPDWLGEDFPEVGVWSLGYAASPTRLSAFARFIGRGTRDSGYTMPLPDRARQVLDLMVQKGLAERPLLFICHSLGGLLAKQVLRRSKESNEPREQRIAHHTRGVLFLATPHAGAELASFLTAFKPITGATVTIEELRAHHAQLADLFDWYRNNSLPAIHTVSYFESRPVKGLLLVVNRTSAHPGVGIDPVALDEDHISIAKPRKRDAQVYEAARHFIRTYLLYSKSVDSEPAVLPPAPTVMARSNVADRPLRIPRELPPEAHKFFGREIELKELTSRLRRGLNTAVVGPAGLGKTALAARALADTLGANAVNLGASRFPDGLVYLDLYTFHGQAEQAWGALANRLGGADFMEHSLARERAREACRARQILLILEGGEEADGTPGRATIPELLSVLSAENRWLLLTRVNTQSAVAESLYLKEALQPEDAAALLRWLTRTRPLSPNDQQAVLKLLEGHPLALNWAGNLLARDDENAANLIKAWKSGRLPKLSDPKRTERTLQWLFARSVRGLGAGSRQVLAAAGLLAHAPFCVDVMSAVIGNMAIEGVKPLVQRGLVRPASQDCWQFTHVLAYGFARDEDDSDPALRQQLAEWLRESILEALASASKDASASLATSLQHAGALLRADPDQRLWESLVKDLLYDVADRLEITGRLDLVSRALTSLADWFARFPDSKTKTPYWLQQRLVLAVSEGDLLRAQGDLAGALALYRDALAVRKRLATSHPSNDQWQRDLGVSQGKVGDALRAQGDLAGALAAHREALAVSRHLAARDPLNDQWQRDLSVNLNKVGDVLQAQNDLAAALASYREALDVRQGLAARDPETDQWHRDISASRNKVGDLLWAQGDLAGALAAYREALAISTRLAAAHPSNAQRLRDLTVSQNKVGDVLQAKRDLAGALAMYLEALDVRQRLAARDPLNEQWQRDLSVSRERVGDVLRAQGDLAGALAAYRQALGVSQRLAADPLNAQWQRDLAQSLNKVGDVLAAQRDLDGALAAYREGLAVSRHLVALGPSNADWQRDLSFLLTRVAELLEQMEDRAEALAAAEESLRLDERLAALDRSNAIWQRDVARSRALVARLRSQVVKA